ncbi:MAG: WG repeat-containing protein, partial [Bacteroidota bacterium]
ENGLWGAREMLTGKEMVEPAYHQVKALGVHGLGLVIMGPRNEPHLQRFGLVNYRDGFELLSPSMREIQFEDFLTGNVARGTDADGASCLINEKGEVKSLEDVVYMRSFDNGLAITCQSKLSPIDPKTKELLPVEKIRGTWGIMTRGGKWRVNPKFDYMLDWQDELAFVRSNTKWGVIDRKGRELVKPLYDTLQPLPGMAERMFAFGRSQNKYAIVDERGKLLFISEMDLVERPVNGAIRAKKNGKWGFLDVTGKEIVPFRYANAGDFYDGLARVRIGPRWGFVNMEGELAIPSEMLEVGDFSEGLAAARDKRGFGFIDTLGNWVIKPGFDDARGFLQQHAVVKKNGKFGIINRSGSWVLKPEYRKINRLANHYVAFIGLKESYFDLDLNKLTKAPEVDAPEAFVVSEEERKELMSRYSFSVIRPKREGVYVCKYSFIYGVVNDKGEELLRPEYDMLSIESGRYQMLRDGKLGYMDDDGIWIRPID